jgi:hypothetical protein
MAGGELTFHPRRRSPGRNPTRNPAEGEGRRGIIGLQAALMMARYRVVIPWFRIGYGS